MDESEDGPVEAMLAIYESKLRELRTLREQIFKDPAHGKRFDEIYKTDWYESQQDRWAGCHCFANRWFMLHTLPRRGTIVEVGTQRGKWARQILNICAPKKLYTVDISYELFEYGDFSSELANKTLEIMQGDSAEELKKLPDRSCDWIYIDAGHSYGHVRNDALVALTKIKPDGFLVFNDFTNFSPVEFLHYGVLRVALETAAQEDMVFTHFALGPTGYHDVALRRRLYTLEG